MPDNLKTIKQFIHCLHLKLKQSRSTHRFYTISLKNAKDTLHGPGDEITALHTATLPTHL